MVDALGRGQGIRIEALERREIRFGSQSGRLKAARREIGQVGVVIVEAGESGFDRLVEEIVVDDASRRGLEIVHRARPFLWWDAGGLVAFSGGFRAVEPGQEYAIWLLPSNTCSIILSTQRLIGTA